MEIYEHFYNDVVCIFIVDCDLFNKRDDFLDLEVVVNSHVNGEDACSDHARHLNFIFKSSKKRGINKYIIKNCLY